MIWRFKAKAFSGPIIYLIHDLGHLLIVQVIDVFAFWDVLPDQTIGIFVEAPLPGVIRVSEEPFGFQVVGNLLMVSEFSAIVVSQGEDAILIGFQVVTDRLRNSLRCFIGGLDSNAKSRFTLNKRHKD